MIEYVLVGVAVYVLYSQYRKKPEVEMRKRPKIRPINTSTSTSDKAQPASVTLQETPSTSNINSQDEL